MQQERLFLQMFDRMSVSICPETRSLLVISIWAVCHNSANQMQRCCFGSFLPFLMFKLCSNVFLLMIILSPWPPHGHLDGHQWPWVALQGEDEETMADLWELDGISVETAETMAWQSLVKLQRGRDGEGYISMGITGAMGLDEFDDDYQLSLLLFG